MASAFGFRKLLVVVAGLFGLAALGHFLTRDAGSQSAKGLGPVVPMSAPSYDLPFLAEAARDPDIASRKPEDDIDAGRLANELKEFRSDLGRAQGERAAELHEMAYQASAALAYFFEDVSSGRIDAPNARNGALANLASMRSMTVNHASQAARLLKSDAAKSRALFHVYATQYALGQSRGKAADALAKLSTGKLSAQLKRRAEMIAALHQLDGGGAAGRSRAEGVLKRLAPTLPGAGQVAVHLTLARSLAGMSRNGKKVGGAHAAYRNYLNLASQKAVALAPAHKDATLRAILGIWRGAEGSNIDWSKAPFRMNAFAGAVDVKAVVERAALQSWAQGNRADAIRKYEGLANSLNGSPIRGEVDLRILDLRRADYAQTKSPKAYEAALLRTAKTYLDTSVLGDGQEAKAKAIAAEVTRRHKSLVHGEMNRVAQPAATNVERQGAIRMAEAYISTLSENKEIEDVKGKIAGLYAMSKQHGKAVALYKELAETGEQANARRYWGLAIRSQSVLAAWPEEAPWGGIKAAALAEREELLMLYRKLDGDKPSWFVAAHVGLLEMQAGRAEQAFSLWQDSLKKDAKGPHAANAAGTMLVAYRQASDWANLESLSRLCLSQRVAAVYRNAPVAPREMLALALLEGGKSAIEQGQYAVAVKKLKEFVTQHDGANRHDEGFYLLAVAQRGNAQHADAIKTLLAFVERYQKSQYFRPALLNGGDWSAAMAYEENTIFFYNKFVTAFGGDQEAQRIRASLGELYVGRALFAEAIGVLSLTSRAKGVDANTQAAALADIMDIEERHGSMANAAQVADKIIAHGATTDEQKAQAMGMKIRFASRSKRLDVVQQLEARLATMSGSQAAQEALGEARYILAFAQGKATSKRYFNLELKDPQTTLKQRFAAFGGARQAYERVCEAGQTSFCAPAMHQLGRLCEEFMRSIEDIEIQDTLAKEVVEGFRRTKQGIMNEVTSVSQRADGKAVAVVNQGYTDPDWVQAVLWQNNADWNFERVSGETGNGYVQWSAAPAAAAE